MAWLQEKIFLYIASLLELLLSLGKQTSDIY